LNRNVSVVIPTYNEQSNIARLLTMIFEIDSLNIEAIVVDDGSDKTSEIAESMGARVVKGQRKGLGQAIIDGINASNSDIVLVMDADLQHDPRDIPRLIEPIMKRGVDFVIGSKYVKGGNTSEWNWFRRTVSTISGYFWYPFLGIHDANSGFFAFRKSILDGVELRPHSWKVMLEVLVKGKWISKLEVPIKFGNRQYGETKNSVKQSLILSIHMVRLIFDKYRFFRFGLVGASLAGVHFGFLFGLTEFANIHYLLSAISSGLITASIAYTINHRWTFDRGKIRHGWFGGWAEYIGVCGIAEIAYIGMLAFFTEIVGMWYLLSAITAICLNYPLKYMIASKYIWKLKDKVSSEDKDFEWRAFYKGNFLRKAWKQKIAKNVARFVNSQPTGTILDLGCGSSPNVLFFNHNDYLGIDLNQSKVDYMNDKKLDDCEFVFGNVVSVNPPIRFDTIICLEVLEHLVSPLSLIKNASESLKDGGKLILATPNNKSVLWKIVEKSQKILQPSYHTATHICLFSQKDVDRMCKQYGLVNVKSERVAFGMDMILYYVKVR